MKRYSRGLLFVLALCAVPLGGNVLADEERGGKAEQPIGTYTIDQIIRFSMDSGWLTAEPSPAPELMTGDELPISIRGSRALWSIRSSSAATASEDRFVELSYRDRGESTQEGSCQATVQCRLGYTSISGTHRCGGETVYVLYRAWREAQTVQVEAYIQEGGELTRTLLNARGATLQEVWSEHPADTCRYLGPVLRKIARRNVLGPGAADLYGAFTSLRADPAASDRLFHLLPRLDAVSPATRQAASADLARMGRAGVLAAMRLGEMPLSPEQQARIGEFIAANRRWALDEPGQAPQDLAFLVECLEDEELAVRQAAKKSIEAAAHRAVAFDCQLEGDDRWDAIAALKKSLHADASAVSLQP